MLAFTEPLWYRCPTCNLSVGVSSPPASTHPSWQANGGTTADGHESYVAMEHDDNQHDDGKSKENEEDEGDEVCTPSNELDEPSPLWLGTTDAKSINKPVPIVASHPVCPVCAWMPLEVAELR